MSDWQQTMAGAIESVEGRYDRLKRRLGHSLGRQHRPIIVPYRSYGSGDRLLVRGRVLDDKQISTGLAEDSIWQNVLSTYRRLESDEIAGARVEARFRGLTAEAVSDDEGYFKLWLEGGEGPALSGWAEVDLRLCALPAGETESADAVAEVLVPSDHAQFGVISDIDDTVMRSYATELIRVVKLTFLGNASTRLPFPGVAAFYRALHRGPDATNPLFYVSSSPWNLYDLLVDFFRLQEIPAGPMFLRDWGITREELLPTDHSRHKLEAIERLFEFYGELPFILIGDSGQQDPEIYAEIVRRHPRRVLAVYVRDVSAASSRTEAVMTLAKEVTGAGSTLILAKDTLVMAEHAVQKGWIEASTIGDIAHEIAMDKGDGDEPVI